MSTLTEKDGNLRTLRRTIPGATLSAVLLVTGGAVSAQAADSAPQAASVTKAQKLAKLKTLTLDSQKSTDAWFTALGQYRTNKKAIKQYKFDWSTDYCSNPAPEKIPGGYDFTFPCYRHDFGSRNYKKLTNKSVFNRDHRLRVDKAFLRDMNTVCGKRFWADPLTPEGRKKAKAACLKTAKKYYNAVRALG